MLEPTTKFHQKNYNMNFNWWQNTVTITHVNTLLSTYWSSKFGSQVTDTKNLPDPTFWEPYDCNKATTHLDTISISCRHFFC
jgi:hypothetical protein